jgi:hypothetical protein
VKLLSHFTFTDDDILFTAAVKNHLNNAYGSGQRLFQEEKSRIG